MSVGEWERPEIDEEQLAVIRPVLERHRQYWPLSPRQLFYQVVKEGGAGLWLDEFVSFARVVRAGLIGGGLPLGALAGDREELRQGGAWDDTADFVHSEIESFLWGYRRDLMQGQEHYLEVWVQKPEMMDLIADVAVEYCVTTVCCGGLPGVEFMQELRRRTEEAQRRSQSTVILFFGDYSPEGTGFLTRVQETLRSDGNLWEMEFRHEAVTSDDVVYLISKGGHSAGRAGGPGPRRSGQSGALGHRDPTRHGPPQQPAGHTGARVDSTPQAPDEDHETCAFGVEGVHAEGGAGPHPPHLLRGTESLLGDINYAWAWVAAT